MTAAIKTTVGSRQLQYVGSGEDRGVMGNDDRGVVLALSRVGDRYGHVAIGDDVKCIIRRSSARWKHRHGMGATW